MSLVVLLPLVPLGLYFVPVYLLRRREDARVQDFVIASDHTPPGVIQNSSIAYALKMATFGPFFAWGASGEIWPAIIAAVSFGLGLCLLYALRRPLLAFLAQAMGRDQSITVHEFLAQRHGGDRRIRLFAASLTLIALVGLMLAELIALASALAPVLPAVVVDAVVIGMLIVMLPLTVWAGNSGVLRAGQTQLGLIYLGLFGAMAFLLYLQTSALTPMPAHGTLAVLWTALFFLALVGYRRSRYVDTSPITTASGRKAGFFRGFEKVLNVVISIFAVLAIVLAVMQLSSEGVDAAMQESLAALRAGPRLPVTGLVALLLLLLYPLADITNWQRLAAFEKSALSPEQRAAALRRLFRVYAVEGPLMWLFMWVFGAIAVVATATPGDTSNVFEAVIGQLAAPPNLIVTIALSLLLVAVFAMAVSMMGAAYSASICTLRYDVLRALRPELASDDGAAKRRTLAAAALLCLVIVAGFCLARATLRISFDSSLFLALVFAVCCAQLALVPLLLRPLTSEPDTGRVSAGSALAALAAGCAATLAAVAIYLATGREAWLWAAAPACLGAGLLLAAAARMRPTASPGP